MKKTLTIVLLSFVVFTTTSDAQFRMKLGPSLGMNFNLHTGSDVESGSGIGLVIGSSLDMEFTPTVGMIANLQFYDNRSGSTEKESSKNYQGGGGETVTATVSDESDVSLAYFMVEPLFKLSLPGSGFYFIGGPAFGFNVEGSAERTITETLPPPYTFQNGTNKSELKSKGSIKDPLVRFEFKIGAGYDIELSPLVTVTPQVSFGYGFTKVVEDVAWRILTVQALGTVKFRII